MRFYARNDPNQPFYQSRKFITWQFGASPGIHGERLSLIGAVDGEELIGILEYIPLCIALGEDRLEPAADFRRLCLEATSASRAGGTELMLFFMNEFNIVYGMGADNRAVLDTCGELGFSLRRMLRYSRVLDENMLPWIATSNLLSAVDLTPIEADDTDTTGIHLVTLRAIQADFKTIAQDAGQIYPAKDRAYMDWRYVRHPQHRYDYHHVLIGDELAAIIVTRIQQESESRFTVGSILDIRGSVRFAIDWAFPRVMKHFANLDVGMVDFFIQNDGHEDKLNALGFVSDHSLDLFESHPIPFYFSPMYANPLPVTVFHTRPGYSFDLDHFELFIESHRYDRPRRAA
ncbi:MAG: hypothetical protein AAF492_11340 [Verrucomicrobiota bacterium]